MNWLRVMPAKPCRIEAVIDNTEDNGPRQYVVRFLVAAVWRGSFASRGKRVVHELTAVAGGKDQEVQVVGDELKPMDESEIHRLDELIEASHLSVRLS